VLDLDEEGALSRLIHLHWKFKPFNSLTSMTLRLWIFFFFLNYRQTRFSFSKKKNLVFFSVLNNSHNFVWNIGNIALFSPQSSMGDSLIGHKGGGEGPLLTISLTPKENSFLFFLFFTQSFHGRQLTRI